MAKEHPNADGGWGEGVISCQYLERARCGTSTPSQTAWALMGLLSGKDINSGDQVVERGIRWLLQQQRVGNKHTDLNQGQGDCEIGTWHESSILGLGFQAISI